MKRDIWLISSFIVSFVCCTHLLGVQPAQGAKAFVRYDDWAEVLKMYVNDEGRVDYDTLKKKREALDRFVKHVEDVDISELSSSEKMAFWINAYNGVTMHTIINNYPIKSIRHINFGFVWKINKTIAQGKHSLNDIEHTILRPLGDPRIHFALNCASIGCPKLPKEPFYPDTLEEQLDRESKRFINDPRKVRLQRDTNTLYYSELLNWYKEDFLVVEPDLLSYIKRYLNEDDRQYLDSRKVTMKAMKYDWGLNKQ